MVTGPAGRGHSPRPPGLLTQPDAMEEMEPDNAADVLGEGVGAAHEQAQVMRITKDGGVDISIVGRGEDEACPAEMIGEVSCGDALDTMRRLAPHFSIESFRRTNSPTPTRMA